MLEEMLLEWRHKFEREALRKGLREGRRMGREKGREEGREEGRREGQREGRLAGQRKVLLQQMTLRFGRLPKEIRSQVEQITSAPELNRLARRILVAKSLQDLGLGKP